MYIKMNEGIISTDSKYIIDTLHRALSRINKCNVERIPSNYYLAYDSANKLKSAIEYIVSNNQYHSRLVLLNERFNIEKHNCITLIWNIVDFPLISLQYTDERKVTIDSPAFDHDLVLKNEVKSFIESINDNDDPIYIVNSEKFRK